MNRHPRRLFFTMVELLMVVVIIIILLAIILPGTSTVRDRGKRAACSSNLRQIGMGLSMYAEEHDARYPACTRMPSSPPANEAKLPGVTVPLLPYLKDPRVFLCPAEVDEHYFRSEGSSYEWNPLYNGWKTGRKALEVSVGSISNLPVPVMFDYGNFHGPADSKTSRNFLYPQAQVSAEKVTPELQP